LYLNVLNQEGSTPKDLFDDIMKVLKEDYKRQKDSVKQYFKANSLKFPSNTKFEEFEEKMNINQEYQSIKKIEQRKLIWNHFMKKARLKDKQQHKNEKKIAKKFENFLRKQKNLKENSSFESIKEEIDKVEKFNKLTEEKKN